LIDNELVQAIQPVTSMSMRASIVTALLCLAASSGQAAVFNPAVILPGHIELERGPDGNTVVLDAPDGLVIVDTGRHPEHVRAVLEHAADRNLPIVAVINTHWHLDHTTGNRDVASAFPDVQIVTSPAVIGALDGFLARSRDEALKQLRDTALPDAQRRGVERSLATIQDRSTLVPDVSVVKDGVHVIGGRQFQLHLAANAVTQGDVWILVADEDLVIAGDLVVAQMPFFDTGCEDGWIKALDAISAAKWARLVPGHGAIMDRADFNRWRSAFTAFVDCAKSARSAAECTTGWQRDAAGFFSEHERNNVTALGNYYISEVLRRPAKERVAYCRAPRIK
jgi:glyoxylase-like metal-dependent hydrolase (beta-lactamase superfamily II)